MSCPDRAKLHSGWHTAEKVLALQILGVVNKTTSLGHWRVQEKNPSLSGPTAPTLLVASEPLPLTAWALTKYHPKKLILTFHKKVKPNLHKMLMQLNHYHGKKSSYVKEQTHLGRMFVAVAVISKVSGKKVSCVHIPFLFPFGRNRTLLGHNLHFLI